MRPVRLSAHARVNRKHKRMRWLGELGEARAVASACMLLRVMRLLRCKNSTRNDDISKPNVHSLMSTWEIEIAGFSLRSSDEPQFKMIASDGSYNIVDLLVEMPKIYSIRLQCFFELTRQLTSRTHCADPDHESVTFCPIELDVPCDLRTYADSY